MFNNWLKTIFTTAGLIVVSFITSVISARWLGPEGRGVLSSALLVMTLSSGIGQLGLGAAFVYACRIDTSFSGRNYFFISAITTTLLATLLAGFALRAGTTLQPQLFLPLLLLTGVTTANSFASTVTQLSPGLSAFNAGRIGLAIITLLIFLILVGLEKFTVANILWAQVITTLVIALFLSNVGLRLIQSQAGILTATEGVTPSSYFINGLKFHGTTLLSLLLLNIDKLTLYMIGNATEFGLYSVAYGTSRLLGSIQDALSTALYARFAGKDPARLTEVVQLSFRLSFLPLLLLALLLGGLSPWLLQLVYGHAFAEVALPFAILLVECVIGNASWILAQQFNATGRPGMVLIRQLAAVGPVLLLVIWIPRDHIALSLSLILLLSAFIRLTVTILMFKWVSNLPLPRFIPTAADFDLVCKNFNQLIARRTY